MHVAARHPSVQELKDERWKAKDRRMGKSKHHPRALVPGQLAS